MLSHKGYIGKVEFDEDADIFHGRVINVPAVITFQGTSVNELKTAFIDSVNDYLESCAELGEEPEKSYSGKFVLRLPLEIHREATLAAKLEEKSLNAWITDKLSEAVKT